MFPLFRYTRFKWSVRNCGTKIPKDIAENILKNDTPKDEFKDEEDVNKITNEILKEYPEPPTTCCMSGCPTCVWLDYADKLSEYYKDGGDKALKDIEKQITDPNMKAYLLHELRMRKKR